MPLRIAHLIETDGPGGAERMVAHLAGDLQSAGHENIVCLPANGEGWLGREVAARGVSTEAVQLLRVPMWRAVTTLVQIFRRHRVHVAHSHEFTMAVYGACAARWLGMPHVITMHGGRYYAGRWRRRFALRAAIGLSDGIVAVADRFASTLSRDLWIRRARVLTIPNGIPQPQPGMATLRRELGLRDADRLVLAVGNLYPVKGHVNLVEAIAMLRERYPIHLAIAGRGERELALRARAADLGVGDCVHILGLRSDIPDLLAAADVYALPSLSEGLPLALLEAMAAARPVVASAVGEIPKVLDHGRAGLLVPPGDAYALAAAITRLIDDPREARQLGERAARRVAAEYSLSRMVGRYSALYASVLPTVHARCEPTKSIPEWPAG